MGGEMIRDFLRRLFGRRKERRTIAVMLGSEMRVRPAFNTDSGWAFELAGLNICGNDGKILAGYLVGREWYKISGWPYESPKFQ